MSLIDKTTALFAAMEKQEWHTVDLMLADDFLYYGPTPDPFDKQTWMDFQRAVHAAFPDWKYDLHDVHEDGYKVNLTVHITGTHTEPLSLPLEHVPTLPATGKKIELPIENAHLIFHGDRVGKLTVDQKVFGSLPALLGQLGLE